MNTVRINGQDYTSSLSDAEIAFIGNLSLPTTAQTLSGAIAEHENDISELNSKIVKYKKLTFTGLTNSSSSGFYLGLTSNLKSLLGETDLDLVSATIYTSSGFGNLVGIETSENSTYLNFVKGTTFSNASITITYAYVPK